MSVKERLRTKLMDKLCRQVLNNKVWFNTHSSPAGLTKPLLT